MKIKEVFVKRYGPLKNLSLKLGNFNLIWGRNEAGKSLTVDAIIKLLLGRKAKLFPNINRVDERPEGYLILELQGREVKLPEKGTLEKLCKIHPHELRGIFTVRNSDLSLDGSGRESEPDFYRKITDKLTGLRSERISAIKEAIRDMGKITPTGSIRNVKGEYLKDKLIKADKILKRIENLMEKAKVDHLDKLEGLGFRIKSELTETEKRLESLNRARLSEKYRKGKRIIERLKALSKELQRLLPYRKEDKEKWKECEREANELTRMKEKIIKERNLSEERLKKLSEELRELEARVAKADERKRKAEYLKESIRRYVEREKEYASKLEIGSLARETVLPLSIALLASLTGYLLKGGRLFHIFSVILFVLFLSSILVNLIFLIPRRRFKEELLEIKKDSAELGVGWREISELVRKIDTIIEEHNRLLRRFEELRAEKKELEKSVLSGDRALSEIEKRLETLSETIESIKNASGEETLESYSEKLDRKTELLSEKRSLEEAMVNLFGEGEQNLKFWEEKIKELEPFVTDNHHEPYSERKIMELGKRKKELEEHLKRIENKMESFREEIKEIGREVLDIIQYEGPCETFQDLKSLKEKLSEFVRSVRENAEDARIALEILDELERDEREKVTTLFGPESPVSFIFSDLTDGLYSCVEFDPDLQVVIAKRADGTTFTPDKLSGGTYDQLYFSIRVSLGEKLAGGEKAFFILDDPFVKSDPDRLKNALNMLLKLSASGWQIIYLSSKSEIKKGFEKEVACGRVTYMELEG